MFGTTKFITLEAAKKMMAAGETEARKNGWNVAITIVDASGDLIMFQKLDETQPGSVKISQGKACVVAVPEGTFESSPAFQTPGSNRNARRIP